jgi:hypothetical protein
MDKTSFAEKKTDQAPRERRGKTRLPLDCDALILTSVSSDAIECRVMDISDSGAKLLIKGISLMPQTFKLLILEAGLLYACEIVRRDRETVGVKFLSREAF